MALALRLFCSQDSRDRPGQSLPFIGFFDELLATGRRQRIEPGLTVVGGNSPFGRNPPTLFEALKRGIESAMFDEQLFLGSLLDGARDALAVLRAKNQGAEDEEIESALEEIEPFFGVLGRHITRVWAWTGKMST